MDRHQDIKRNPAMRPRPSGHHDDAPPIKLVTLFLALRPGQEGLLVHVNGKLHIHVGKPALCWLI